MEISFKRKGCHKDENAILRNTFYLEYYSSDVATKVRNKKYKNGKERSQENLK